MMVGHYLILLFIEHCTNLQLINFIYLLFLCQVISILHMIFVTSVFLSFPSIPAYAWKITIRLIVMKLKFLTFYHYVSVRLGIKHNGNVNLTCCKSVKTARQACNISSGCTSTVSPQYIIWLNTKAAAAW